MSKTAGFIRICWFFVWVWICYLNGPQIYTLHCNTLITNKYLILTWSRLILFRFICEISKNLNLQILVHSFSYEMAENFRNSARKFCSIAGTFRNVPFPSRNMKIFITVYESGTIFNFSHTFNTKIQFSWINYIQY